MIMYKLIEEAIEEVGLQSMNAIIDPFFVHYTLVMIKG